MSQGQHKTYGNISFVEHSIPNVSITTYFCGRIYYYHQKHICSYELSSRLHTKLYSMGECTGLFIVRNALCAIHGNILRVFEKEPRELKLKRVPRKIIPSNEGAGNRDGVGFLYENSIEIFNIGKYPIQVVDVPLDLKIVDLANAEDVTYILDEQGRVFVTKSIFLTRQIVCAVPLVVIPEVARVYSGISACDGMILLTALLDTKKSIWVEKYDIDDGSLVLMYSFTSRLCPDVAVKSGFLFGECMVHLSNAPILVLEDQICNIFQFRDSEWIGVSTGKVYFIDETSKEPDNRLSYEMASHKVTTNPNEIEVPRFIKDEGQINHFLRNEILLRGCEAILDRVKVIDGDLERRESELNAQGAKLRNEIERIERKKVAVEERIYALMSRARRVRIKGSTEGFYNKIRVLEKEMEGMSGRDLSELKERLKAQRAVLRGKMR